jgi:hypothetical protein
MRAMICTFIPWRLWLREKGLVPGNAVDGMWVPMMT